MARMNPLKKYAVGMAAIAAVSGGIGMAQTFLPHNTGSTTPVAQVQTSTPVTESTVVDAVDTVHQQVVDPTAASTPTAQNNTYVAPRPNAKIVVPDPTVTATATTVIDTEQLTSDDTYVEPVESEDDYVWVEERHEHEHEYEYEDDHEDGYEGGGYDE